MASDTAAPCPCSKRTLEDQAGRIVWRATDNGEWCGNRARPYVTAARTDRDGARCASEVTA